MGDLTGIITPLSGGTGGGVTSIAFGSGLTGGTVTTTGSVAIDTTASLTWSGSQTHSGAWIATGTTAASTGTSSINADVQTSTTPTIRWTASTAAADTKFWEIQGASGGNFTIRCVNDAYTVNSAALAITRTAAAITAINIGNATDNPAVNFLGTGNVIASGALRGLSIAATGSGVPGNGINQFSSNVLGLYTSSTQQAKIDANGNFTFVKARADLSKSVQVPTTGFTITVANNTSTLILNPAGTLATGTVTMPATPIDGQEVRFSSTQTVTTLTVSPNTSQTISNAPTTIAPGQGYAWIYHLATTNWFRLY